MDVKFLNRRSLKRAWLAVFIGLSATALASVPNGGFLVREWTTDDGMPQNVVLSMAQTRDG